MASFFIKEINLSASCRDYTKAFTLPELLFVLIIMAILATLAVAIWPGKQVSLNAQSQQLLSDMRYIRNYAMTHDEQYRIYFNPGRRQIALTDRAGGCLRYPLTGECRLTLSSQVNMATLGMPNGYIAFSGDGTPYIGSGRRLTRPAVVILTVNNQSRTVRVIPGSGALLLS